MKILLVYPKYPDTFWSFKYALKFISKKASLPPLGLLTVAGMLPQKWEKKLVDMNVTPLQDEDIKWADYVFISAMVVQRESVKEIIDRCKKMNKKIVAGGPLFTTEYEKYERIDHLVLNEAEITLPFFIRDLEKNNPKHIYRSKELADIKDTPLPLWELLDMKKYSSMSIQYSRGCPFDCEFCDIPFLYGHTPRTKDTQQMIDELEALYREGWRGGVFIVDDNFIGNKIKLKNDILPAMIKWMEKKKYPFSFFTETSINLSDDEELMRLMVKAGFDTVFVGIETPNEESLNECGKIPNKNRNMIESIKKLQRRGLQVQGGFILGFDSDSPSIFNRMVRFIQKSGIVTAMVGLLNAPRGSRLYQRLLKEKRLLKDISGNNTDFSMNFKPKMSPHILLKGYRKVIQTLYSPKHYYKRIMNFIKEYRYLPKGKTKLDFAYIKAFFKSIWYLGLKSKGRLFYWKTLLWSFFRKPLLLPKVVTLAIYGFHFQKVFKID